MQIDLSKFIRSHQTVAVALSGGCDSMALLHYMLANAEKFHINVIALNVEHGIRGEESLSDSQFCKDFCEKLGVPLLSYSVDAKKKAQDEKLSIEQAARILRYECFFDAIKEKKCDKIATAHHADDNAESILFNLFRGTGVKGACGITSDFDDKIIRPFLSLSKEQIQKYAEKNNIPFVTDSTNFSTDYTRNALRLNVIPKIKEIFPRAIDGICRFAEILKQEDDFLQKESEKAVKIEGEKAVIGLPVHPAIFARAVIIALGALGIEKDYEKIHVDDAISLINKQNGSSINLPKGVIAIKEYDKIVFFKREKVNLQQISFALGEFSFCDKTIKIEKTPQIPKNLKDGFFIDLDKVPTTAIIRVRADGDEFTKFGGGTKSLNDYFTDKKIPLRERDFIPLLADKSEILAIFGVAISDKLKVDATTKTVVQLNIDRLW